MSGLKINFHKSEVYCLGEAKVRSEQFEEILTCKIGTLPLKYLKSSQEKKLGFYFGKNLNISGRTLLIKLHYLVSYYTCFLSIGSLLGIGESMMQLDLVSCGVGRKTRKNITR
jgi:hypothetical protein